MYGEHNELHDAEEVECVFIELDEHFSDKEISEQIHNLKTDTAPGIDGFLNEMFVKYENIFLPILSKLFNHILSTGRVVSRRMVQRDCRTNVLER